MLKLSLIIWMLVVTHFAQAQSSQSSRLVIVSPPTSTTAKSSSMSSKSSVAASLSASSVVNSSSMASSQSSGTIYTPTCREQLQGAWVTPTKRKDGTLLKIDPVTKLVLPNGGIGGYEMRYRLVGSPEWTYEAVFPKLIRSYKSPPIPCGIYEFEVGVYDQRGLYSEFMSLTTSPPESVTNLTITVTVLKP